MFHVARRAKPLSNKSRGRFEYIRKWFSVNNYVARVETKPDRGHRACRLSS